jgi:hypothetical protein
MKLKRTWSQAIREISEEGGNLDEIDSDNLADVWMQLCSGNYRPDGVSEEVYIVDAYVDDEYDDEEPDLLIEHGYIA